MILVLIKQVLHATESLYETLTNVGQLLAPQGRVFLQELSPGMCQI